MTPASSPDANEFFNSLLVLVGTGVAFLATTLPSVLQDLMAGRFPRKQAFSDDNQPEQALG